MKAKTIKRILRNKFDSFTKSITDKHVKKLVKKNSIITGGAIASMLLGEDVNDYDIYFTNKETALAVANYYVSKFKKNTKPMKFKDNSHVVDISVREYEDRVSIVVASSGVATDREINDYQYFETTDPGSPETEEFIENVCSYTKENKPKEKDKYRPVYLTSNAITLSDNVQLIVRFYGNAEEIHRNYDFIHCTNYWTSEDGELHLRKDALETLLAKELRYVGSLYPISSIIRTRKFIKRGWSINAGQFLKMAFQVNELNLQDPLVLKDQLIGVDVAYFFELLSIINKEKETGRELDATYIAELIDKVF